MLPHQLIVLHLCAMSRDDHTYNAANYCAASALPSKGPVSPPELSELFTLWTEPFIDGFCPSLQAPSQMPPVVAERPMAHTRRLLLTKPSLPLQQKMGPGRCSSL